MTLTACNTDYAAPAEITLGFAGAARAVRSAQVLATPVLTACNTFDQPRAVTTRPLDGVRAEGARVRFSLPPGSVAALRFA